MRRVLIFVALVAAFGWFAYIAQHRSRSVGGSDSSGYFNEANMLASGNLRMIIPSPDFIPLGFRQVSWDQMAPLYPPGYPLHVALFGRFAFLVTPIAALICLLLMFALARSFGLSDGLAIASALILATVPAFLLMSLQPMSDVVSLMWCMVAMLFAVRRWPVLAGVAFSIAVWVRPSNLLLAIPLALVLRRRSSIAAIAALPLGIALVIFNHAMYGDWFTTGYGAFYSMMTTNSHALFYARWLLLYLAGALVVFDRDVASPTRVLLIAWFGVFFLFYSFFEPIGDWGYTRFLLPAIPALIIGLMLMLRRQRVLATLLIVVIAFTGMHFARRQHIFSIQRTESVYPQTIAWAQQHVPQNATIASMQLSGAFLYYANRFTLRYDLAKEIPPNTYAVIFDWEEPLLPGRWKRVERFKGGSLMQFDDVLR